MIIDQAVPKAWIFFVFFLFLNYKSVLSLNSKQEARVGAEEFYKKPMQ